MFREIVVILAAILVIYESMNLYWFLALNSIYVDYPFNWRILISPYKYLDWESSREEETAKEEESSDDY